MNARHTDCCDEYEDLVKWSSALSIKMSVGNHQLAQWNSISAAGAAPQAQLITVRCRCNYHTLKATIVARSTFSVNDPSVQMHPASPLFSFNAVPRVSERGKRCFVGVECVSGAQRSIDESRSKRARTNEDTSVVSLLRS